MKQVIPGLAVGGGFATLLLLVWWQLVREKQLQNGLYVWQRWSLYRNGARATGKLLNEVNVKRVSGGSRRIGADLMDYVVDVTPEQGETYRVSMRYLLYLHERDALTRGPLPLRYDRTRPSRIVIDWPAIRGGQA